MAGWVLPSGLAPSLSSMPDVHDPPGFISDAKLIWIRISSIGPQTQWTQERSRAAWGRMLEILVPASCPPRASMGIRFCKWLCNHSFSTPFCSPILKYCTSLTLAFSFCTSFVLLFLHQQQTPQFSNSCLAATVLPHIVTATRDDDIICLHIVALRASMFCWLQCCKALTPLGA